MICPNCHTPNRPSARYCDGCGYELPAVEPLAALEAAPASRTRLPIPEDPYEQDEPPAARRFALDGSSAPTADLEGDDAPTVSLEEEDEEDGILLPVIGAGPADDALTAPLDPPAAPDDGPDGAVAAEARDYRADDGAAPAPRRFSKRRMALIAALCALLAILAVAVTAGVQLFAGVVVPNVVGLSQVDATYMVQESGFRVKAEEVISDEVEGIVLSTEPGAGVRLAEGATVTLRVSKARTIPEVVGKPLGEAQALLGEAGFTNIEVKHTKSNEAADTVLSVTPEANTRSRSDALITLEAAEPFRVPEVAGLGQQEATDALAAEGYTVDVQRYNTEDTPEGTAIKTDPAGGTVLASGSQVVLYVAHNRSAELVGLTRKFFTDAATITIDGSPYEMINVAEVAYSGGNSCTFSINVRPIQTVTWFGTQIETRYGNLQTVNGSMTWTDANQVASVEPAIKQGG